MSGIRYTASTDGTQPQYAYEVFRYMNVNDGVTGAAIEHLVQHSPYNNTGRYDAGLDRAYNANLNGVMDKGTAITNEGLRYRGPYTETVTITTQPTATNPNGKGNVVVRSASGHIMPGQTLTLSGATGLPRTVTSGGNAANLTDGAAATFGFTAANSQSGSITATDGALPATAVKLLTHYPLSDNYQRLVATGQPTTSRASAAFTRPAVPTGTVVVHKQDAAGGAALAGADFHIMQGSKDVSDQRTNAAGNTGVVSLAPGSYTAVEVVAPSGYLISAASTPFSVAPGQRTTVTVKDTQDSKVSVHKTDAATGAALAGATFQVHPGGPTARVVATGTTDAAGNWVSPYLGSPVGTSVTLTESQAPAGYVTVAPLSAKTTRTGDGTGAVKAVDTRRVGGLVVVSKVDQYSGKAVPGTTFTVTVKKTGAADAVPVTGGQASGTGGAGGNYITAASGNATINGNASTPKLAFGDQLTFTETAAAPGYVLPTPALVVTGTVGTTAGFSGTAKDQQTGIVTITKVVTDSDGNVDTSADRSGAYYSVTDTTTGKVISPKAGPTDASGKLSLELGSTKVGDTISVVEQIAPAGAGLNQTPVTGKVVADNTTGAVRATLTQTDVELSLHTVATGPQGTHVIPSGGPGVVTDTVDYTAGLTPGKSYTMSATLVDASGKTVATGSTKFTPTSSAAGSVKVTINVPAVNAGDTLTVLEYLQVTGAPAGTTPVASETTPNNTEQTVYSPEVTTNAINTAAGFGQVAAAGATVNDTVHICNLAAGNYSVTGTAIAINAADVQYPVSATGSAKVTSTSTKCQDVVVPFKLGSDVKPGSSVIFQEVVVDLSTHQPVAVNRSLTDKAETVYSPSISTKVINSAVDFGQIANTGDTVNDTVHLCDLAPGTYTVTGTAVGITAAGVQYAVSAKGSATVTTKVTGCQDVVVPFRLGSDVKPGSSVVFEEVVVNAAGVTVAKNTSTTDKAETVYSPSISTKAINTAAGFGQVAAAGSTVNDTVHLCDLAPGTYTVTGTAVGVLNGVQYPVAAKGSATITTKITGCQDVVVPFVLGSEVTPGSSVVFQEIVVNAAGVTVAKNTSTADKAETVYVPSIGTNASNSNAALGKTVTSGSLIDVIDYANLPVGQPVTMKGVFEVIQADGKVVPTTIISSATFTPTSSTGSATVTFPVSPAQVAQYAGDTLVAYEDAIINGRVVASHHVPTSTPQTVYVPKIGTTLGNGGAHYDATNGLTLVDTIAYGNLTVGQKYIATGTLMKKANGNGAIVSAGVPAATIEFTPTSPSGVAKVSLRVPAHLIASGDVFVVAYESVAMASAPRIPVATHQDFNSKSQSAFLSFGSGMVPTPTPTPTPTVPAGAGSGGNGGGAGAGSGGNGGGQVNTGQGASNTQGINMIEIGLGMMLLLGLAGGAVLVIRRRRTAGE